MTYPAMRTVESRCACARIFRAGDAGLRQTAVYLDNAASAQKPSAVLDLMTEAYKTEYANVDRGMDHLATLRRRPVRWPRAGSRNP